MGSLATVGQHGPPNLKHIIINNGAHDSVGGQPTVSGNHTGFSFGMIAQGCGYKEVSIIYCNTSIILSLGNEFIALIKKNHKDYLLTKLHNSSYLIQIA